jgi:hypothetical protein
MLAQFAYNFFAIAGNAVDVPRLAFVGPTQLAVSACQHPELRH